MSAPSNERFASLAAAVAHDRDRQAFEKLFDHFAPRLVTYLRGLGLDHGQAEEVAQEAMTVLWHKAAQFDPGKSSLSTWLFRVARNRRIDLSRREQARVFDPEDTTLHPCAPIGAQETLEAEQRDARVRAALEALPAEQKALVRMAFFRGMPHSRIAEETGLPLGTVKSRLRLAFGRLRRAFDGDPAVATD